MAKRRSSASQWEVIQESIDVKERPEVFSGYLYRKKNGRLKRWCKRYFVIDSGMLKYSKNENDFQKGKILGVVDVGRSVISTHPKFKRIDIDGEEAIHHLKVKSVETYEMWLENLAKHQVYFKQEDEATREISRVLKSLTELEKMVTTGNHTEYHSMAKGVYNSLVKVLKLFSDQRDLRFPNTTIYRSNASDASSLDESIASASDESLAIIPDTGFRTTLPAPRPPMESISVWNLLSKNIGSDLTSISLPITLFHPLGMLQRLCEDLEYSELLDQAARERNHLRQMVLVACFAISAYASTYSRANSKPFNPLLGETYENIREDKGFKYISEQVSHRPSISVCHATSKFFTYWADVQVKSKFWGKSIEIIPIGTSNLKLQGVNGCSYYSWNRANACIHNVFSDKRWLETYGLVEINSELYSCEIDFYKMGLFTSKTNMVAGKIKDKLKCEVMYNFHGVWSEGIYEGTEQDGLSTCLWRANALPCNHLTYYGFTKFAIELNELKHDQAKSLPCTDSRFRPDQRLLEDGNFAAAEETKLRLECEQRERLKNDNHNPRWFQKTTSSQGSESWDFKGNYWDVKSNPGFEKIKIQPIF